jgi:phosphoribosylformylglycinamidine cyclo-ligase
VRGRTGNPADKAPPGHPLPLPANPASEGESPRNPDLRGLGSGVGESGFATLRAMAKNGLTYASAGVDLEGKDSFTESLGGVLRRTYTPRVIDNPGGFAGLFRLDYNERLFKRNYKDPVLVACTDGVGTKVKLATEAGDYSTVGIDLVAMSINDMIVQGAEPLFFLDYIAVSKVERGMLDQIVRGVAEGCRQSGCALLGGETAEMPDIYAPGEFDLAGFAVGVVELKRAINPVRVEKKDVVLGVASSGLHSNGFSLVRKVVKHAGLDLKKVYPEFVTERTEPRAQVRGKRSRHEGMNGAAKSSARGGRSSGVGSKPPAPGTPPTPGTQSHAPTLGQVLLTPTRIYAASIVKLLRAYRVKMVISGMANITGSGLAGNLERALNPKVDAVIDTKAWPVPAVFRALAEHGGVEDIEMRRVFNMGVGYCVIVKPTFAESVAEQLRKMGETVWTIGEIVKGSGKVIER